MFILSAQETLVEAINDAIETNALDDVTVLSPFLGKAVIFCSREASATALKAAVRGLRAG
jgi:hypothetical protein